MHVTDDTQLIERLYEALQRRDHATMAACYHDDAQFSDPVFTDLSGREIAAMWHMLCEQGKDLEVTFSDIHLEAGSGSARWEAKYTFSPSGRQIHNRIRSTFAVVDGRIASQEDEFDLWKWTRQAVGFSGLVAGWTASAKQKVRDQAAKSLSRFIADHPEYEQP